MTQPCICVQYLYSINHVTQTVPLGTELRLCVGGRKVRQAHQEKHAAQFVTLVVRANALLRCLSLGAELTNSQDWQPS